jgi:two-component sensor histidine kinase
MAEFSRSDLDYRLKQQKILSEFGVEALRADDLGRLLQRATELCAEGMSAQFCKALEYKPGHDTLLVIAGVGWGPNVVGQALVGADLASPAGYALKTGQPVISNHLENERRFRTPQLMADHGVRRALNVLIRNREGDFGVLEVDDTREGQFDEADIAFMQGFANLLGGAIERQRAEARLQAALDRQELLTREMSHRVKNSLATVAGLLSLQARGTESAHVREALADARSRVEAVAQVHDQLWRQPDLAAVELAGFLESLCEKLRESAPGHAITCTAPAMPIPADLAIPLGLFVNELVTNAVKHAYPGRHGPVRVEAVPDGASRVLLSVSDDGVGLPEGFDAGAARRSLGMRVIHGLSRQLGGELAVSSGAGARFALRLDLERA